MRSNHIVPLGQYFSSPQIDRCLFLCGAFPFQGVIRAIDVGPTMKAGIRSRPANEFQHHLITHPWFSLPILTHPAEPAMLDPIPLGGSRRIVCDTADYPQLIRPPLPFYCRFQLTTFASLVI